MDKVYCIDCSRYNQPTEKEMKTIITPHRCYSGAIKDTPIKSVPAYNDCWEKNKHNDCQDFKQNDDTLQPWEGVVDHRTGQVYPVTDKQAGKMLHKNRLQELVKPRVTYKDIAEAYGCTISFVTHIGKGRTNPPEKFKQLVSRMLKLPVSAIFPEDGKMLHKIESFTRRGDG